MKGSRNSAEWFKDILHIALFVLMPLCVTAQATDTVAYKADSADVKTIDGIVNALYDVISGEAGPRNWDRLRSLCLPATQFNALIPGRDGKPRFFSGILEDYIKATTPVFMKEAFYEKEVHRVTDQFAGIAHVFSTYESRESKNGEVIERGINSIQLMHDKGRWWVVNLMWSGETEDSPLPPRYLGNK